MSTSRYTFTPTAYVLPLLHAAKNLSSTCLGVLLGRAPSTGEAETIIEDVIPLIHHYTSLSPMTEAALEMVDVYAKEKGLIVAGVYIAHAGEERELDRVGERILDLLKSSHEGAFGLVVDNDKLGQSHIPYIVYTSSKSSTSKDEGKWPEGWSLQKEGTEKAVLGLIRGEERVFRDIVDFDDHLEDPNADWLGNEKVKMVLKDRL